MMYKLILYYGFLCMLFGCDLVLGMLYCYSVYNEVVVCIGWCIVDCCIGVIIGEVGVGKIVVVCVVLVSLDCSCYIIIYLFDFIVGVQGIYYCIVVLFGG